MKTSVILFVVAGGIVLGAIVLLSQRKTAPAPAPIAESTPAPVEPASVPEKNPAPPPLQLPAIANAANEPAPVAVAAAVTNETNSNAATNLIAKAVDALLSAKNGLQKHELFEELRKSGQLEAAIAELQERAKANPKDPAIATTLGEAQLNQIRVLHESGADNDQVGILAMQADQNFNAALKVDPANWEAQFVKASSMFYWPADPARDGQVVQMLSHLIDQQDTMPTQPKFAQSYVVLGNEYEKIGKHAEAQATWVLGAQKFPADPTLQRKISGP